MSNSSYNIKFTSDEMDDLIYATREAQIRFSRLRKCINRGDEDVSHWSIEECEAKMEHYKRLESNLHNKYRETFGTDW